MRRENLRALTSTTRPVRQPAVAKAACGRLWHVTTQRTRNVRIGSSIAVIGLNDPVRVAEEFAMLDNLCGGRLDFGIGRAFERAEFDAFNVPMEQSRARFNEAHDIILRAWKDEPVTYDGKFRHLSGVNVIPKPVQRPHPPIYVACLFTLESFEFAASHGYNLMYVPYVSAPDDGRARVAGYRDSLSRADHDPATREVMMCVHFFQSESADHAREYPRQFMANYFECAAHDASQFVVADMRGEQTLTRVQDGEIKAHFVEPLMQERWQCGSRTIEGVFCRIRPPYRTRYAEFATLLGRDVIPLENQARYYAKNLTA